MRLVPCHSKSHQALDFIIASEYVVAKIHCHTYGKNTSRKLNLNKQPNNNIVGYCNLQCSVACCGGQPNTPIELSILFLFDAHFLQCKNVELSTLFLLLHTFLATWRCRALIYFIFLFWCTYFQQHKDIELSSPFFLFGTHIFVNAKILKYKKFFLMYLNHHSLLRLSISHSIPRVRHSSPFVRRLYPPPT